MGKKEFLIGALVVFVLVGATYLATTLIPAKETVTQVATDEAKKQFDKSKIYYFWGDGCPHCAELDKWVKENKIDQKVTYTKLEVWKNQKNASLMNVAAQVCNITPEGMGVPFVYYNGSCYVGSDEAQKALLEAAK